MDRLSTHLRTQLHAEPAELFDGDAALARALDGSPADAGRGDLAERSDRSDELARCHAALDSTVDAIYQVHRPSMRFLHVNAAACERAGCSRSELLDKGPAGLLQMPRETLEKIYDGVIAAGTAAEPFELDTCHPDGRRLVIEVRRRPLHTPDGWVIVTVSRDITARKLAELARQRAALCQSLLARFGQKALSEAQLDDLFTDAAAIAAEGLGTEYAEISQRDPASGQLVLRAGKGWQVGWLGRSIGGPDDDTLCAEVMRTQTAVGVAGAAENPRIRACALLSDHDVASGLAVPIRGGASGASGVLGVYARRARDFGEEQVDFLRAIANILSSVIARKAAEKQLTQLAQYDTLTGLPNRSLFLDRLTHGLVQAQRHNWRVGVLFVDLDRFKAVNDSLGHDAGDELLRQAARRLDACVRASDTVGRLGGDQFAFLLSNVNWPEDAAVVAQRVVDAMSRPFLIGGEKVHVSASVGIAVYPDDARSPDALLKGADTAMHQAKQRGRRGYQFYLPQMDEVAAEHQQLEVELRGALERQEFVLHYQPKAEVATGRISGFEALLRWNHPQRGLVPPLQFIGILEETGLIGPVGEWVISEACRQIRQWQSDGIEPRPVAINLSARQFQSRELDRVIVGLVRAAGVDPALIEFELTESLLMADADEAAQMLGRLKAAGFRLALDDFGTGYSSLAYLKRFPLDTLKIDRMFMRDVTADVDGASIALAIINLAHSLKLHVVAEGVETRAQLDFLEANGCDEMQGYLLSRPLPAADCSRLLLEGRRL